jgi:hypothetical protein
MIGNQLVLAEKLTRSLIFSIPTATLLTCYERSQLIKASYFVCSALTNKSVPEKGSKAFMSGILVDLFSYRNLSLLKN